MATPKAMYAALIALALCFAFPLYELIQLSMASELHSYVCLVPLVTLYLIWQNRAGASDTSPLVRKFAVALLVLGGAIMGAFALFTWAGRELSPASALSWKILSFVVLVAGVYAFFARRDTLRKNAFPLAFLLLMVPLPMFITSGIEAFLQHASAKAAGGFFTLSGRTFFRDDTFIQLPGFALRVAPECSGIRSSLALFITSVFAGYVFLRSPWKRALLALVVLPLAVLRNGFRIFVIGELCVRVGPHMIDSYIHHHGGPIFFALSLIPFGGLLYWLMRSERRAKLHAVAKID